ncbi:uncharacterized protein [Procambarus clarkii]|uniref:uncharacterized protein n=1 Tax=Procambarus clarkii TaxID=6728 RepID=UPI0037446B8C
MESDTDTSFHHRAAKYRRIANDVDRDSEDSPPRKVTVSMPRKTAECKLTLDEHQNNMIQESETTSDLGFELNRKGFRRPASLLRNRDENLNDYLVASSPFEKSITEKMDYIMKELSKLTFLSGDILNIVKMMETRMVKTHEDIPILEDILPSPLETVEQVESLSHELKVNIEYKKSMKPVSTPTLMQLREMLRQVLLIC